MRWHVENRSSDGMLRHPRDGESWKSFDAVYPEFAADPRNVRLGLATDGFNPFGIMSTNISIWPVMLILYNLPPWMCMKQTSVILSMIIPGKKMPGNDIDVYLQPLIKELVNLWTDGVQTFDASKYETFNMRAVLLWNEEIQLSRSTTISAYRNDVLEQVLGKEHSGRVRGIGLGVCPTKAFGASSYRSRDIPMTPESTRTSSQVQSLQSEVALLKDQLKTMEKTLDIERNRSEAQVTKLYRCLEDRLGIQFPLEATHEDEASADLSPIFPRLSSGASHEPFNDSNERI